MRRCKIDRPQKERLDWADRDEVDRKLGDAPYPPNYPKQEGEPPRVQPSKKVAAHWDEHGNRLDG